MLGSPPICIAYSFHCRSVDTVHFSFPNVLRGGPSNSSACATENWSYERSRCLGGHGFPPIFSWDGKTTSTEGMNLALGFRMLPSSIQEGLQIPVSFGGYARSAPRHLVQCPPAPLAVPIFQPCDTAF